MVRKLFSVKFLYFFGENFFVGEIYFHKFLFSEKNEIKNKIKDKKKIRRQRLESDSYIILRLKFAIFFIFFLTLQSYFLKET